MGGREEQYASQGGGSPSVAIGEPAGQQLAEFAQRVSANHEEVREPQDHVMGPGYHIERLGEKEQGRAEKVRKHLAGAAGQDGEAPKTEEEQREPVWGQDIQVSGDASGRGVVDLSEREPLGGQYIQIVSDVPGEILQEWPGEPVPVQIAAIHLDALEEILTLPQNGWITQNETCAETHQKLDVIGAKNPDHERLRPGEPVKQKRGYGHGNRSQRRR